MKALARLAVPIGICLIAQACSTDRPQDHVAKSPVVVGATDAPASSPGNTSSKPGRIVLEDKTLTNDEVRKLFARGYKPVERRGEIYYCRREQETGSHFATTTCKTADQMKQIEQDSKDALSSVQRGSDCSRGGPGC